MGERVVALERDVDGDALSAQTGGDRVGQLGVILDQQYAHGPPSVAHRRLQRGDSVGHRGVTGHLVEQPPTQISSQHEETTR